MIFNSSLVVTSDYNNVLNTRIHQFFNHILDNWLINNWQHFLWHCFSLRKKSGSKTSSWNNSFSNFLHMNTRSIAYSIFVKQYVIANAACHSELSVNWRRVEESLQL